MVGRALRAPAAVAPAWLPLGASLLTLTLVLLAAIGLGPVALAPDEVLGALLRGLRGETQGTADTIVWQVRLPRALLAAAVGAGLAVAGTAFQAVFRNPLADPYLLGAASGAGFGAAVALTFGATWPWLGALGVAPSAFLAALATITLVLALARRGGRLPTVALILAGVVIGSSLSAGTSFVMLAARERSVGVLTWLLGSFAFADWGDVRRVAPVLLATLAAALAARRPFDLLQLGEAPARSLGVPVEAFKWAVVGIATLLTAVSVAAAGVIGFVGLVTPHAVRLALGPAHGRLLPLAAAWGATFLVLADLLARTVIAPAELPVGILTALVGGPFFLLLLRRGREAA